MKIILNEMSLAGQFMSDEDFYEYLRKELIPMMQLMESLDQRMLKSQHMYAKMVTNDRELMDYLHLSNQSEITALKRYLAQLCWNEPYWETDSSYDMTIHYEYPMKAKEPNCITEALDREAAIISFPGTAFDQYERISASRENKVQMICNIMERKGHLRLTVQMEARHLPLALEKYPYRKKRRVCVRKECREALEDIQLSAPDCAKILENVDRMIDDRMNGRKSHWWDSYQGNVDEYRVSLSEGREFRAYYLWREEITFLWALIKKQQKIGAEETRHILAIADRCMM